MTTGKKVFWWFFIILLLGGAAFCYIRFFYVFSEGYQTGELNQFTHKGYVFKTYEGRLIQTGFKGAKGSSGVQSNEFNFSVVNKEIADSLMRCSGKNVELRYKEYNGALPWRGMQHYIVYEIISVNDAKSGGTEIPIVVGDV